MNNSKINILLKNLCKIFIILLLFLLSGCTLAERPIDHIQYYNILSRSNEFLAFCIYIIEKEEVNIIHLIPRLYYSYFNIAKINHALKYKKNKKVSHKDIWESNPIKAKELYYDNLRKARNEIDYGENTLAKSEENVIAILRESFIPENSKAFNDLIDDFESQSEEFFKNRFSPESKQIYEDSKDLIKIIKENNSKINNLLNHKLK